MANRRQSKNKESYRVLTGVCPDEQCGAKLFFPAYDSSIECTACGQRHEQRTIKNLEEVTNPDVALHNMLKNILLGTTKPKKGTDLVKVAGLSNYQCKLVSPLLTRYGMDKQSGQAKLLTEMGQRETFDCGILAARAFLIDPKHIDTIGYGRDRTGSMNYLRETLDAIKKSNDNEERLLPIHADGDGHCLVHAISRALVGRELFWHALRENLRAHLEQNLETYKNLFCDFVDASEWGDIIDEADPEFIPMNGEQLGLRNMHIFGLANLLKRPIVLLDSISGIQSKGDYSGFFLPGLLEPDKCKSKDGTLNKPLCLAWSSQGRNHYIALVGVKGRPLPKIPGWMVPKVWGMNQELLPRYVDLDAEGCCTIGGDKCLQDGYILRLVTAMEKVFLDKHKVTTALVADVHQFVFKNTGIVGVKPEIVLEQTQRALAEDRLFRCLTCEAISEMTIMPEWFRPGGSLHSLAVKTHGKLDPDKNYSFPVNGLVCSYDADKDELIPDMNRCRPSTCQSCQGELMRRLRGDGSVLYHNGDRTLTPSNSSKCRCGFKHYWEGKEYDNMPELLPVSLEWNGKVVGEKVAWFQHESDPSRNSNVFEVAQALVQKHFPGEFGSERLVQKVVDTILRQTAIRGAADGAEGKSEMGGALSSLAGEIAGSSADPLKENAPTKIILTGHKHKTFHKEELTMSEAEKNVRRQVEAKAAKSQRRKTEELEREQLQRQKLKASPENSPAGKSSPRQSTSLSSPRDQTGGATAASPQGVTSSGGASEQSSPAMPAQKRLRVTTSDGRQMTLTLEAETTFKGFQDLLCKELDIPPERQKIKHGFPPKELHPPEGEKAEEPLAIQHGDRVTLEVLPDPNKLVQETGPSARREPSTVWPAPAPQRQSWSGFDANSRDHSAQEMLKGLSELQHPQSDSLDTSIASLTLMATLTGKDLWSYVQGMPHLFSVGGLFYEQVKRDLGLSDGKHCTLPSLPGKVFRFSSGEDRLELCLEPHGHYPIEPGIEDRILKTSMLKDHLQNVTPPDASSVGKTLSAGGSGVVVNKAMQFPTNHMPFSGQGHSLLSSNENIRMPQDLEPPTHRHKAMKFQELRRSSLTESIEEETEGAAGVAMETTSHESRSREPSNGGGLKSPIYKKIGPAYTVVEEDSEEVTNEIRNTSQLFQNLTSKIESIAEAQDESKEDSKQDAMEGTECADLPSADAKASNQNSSDPGVSSDPIKQTEPMDST